MTSSELRLSVVIPNFGRVASLLRAISSVDNDRSTEVIVVDDQSPNWSDIEQAVQALNRPNLRLLQLPEKGNGAIARNFGVGHARGEWILFLDSDDTFLPGRLASFKSELQRDDNADVFVFGANIVVDGNWSRQVPTPWEGNLPSTADYLFTHRETLQTSMLAVRRSISIAAPFNPTYQRHQDWDFLLSLEEHGARIRLACDGTPLTNVYWDTKRSPNDKGETANYSLRWGIENSARLGQSNFRRFLQRMVVIKALREGNRSLAWRVMMEHRTISRFSDLLTVCALSLMPAQMRRSGYRIYKRLRG